MDVFRLTRFPCRQVHVVHLWLKDMQVHVVIVLGEIQIGPLSMHRGFVFLFLPVWNNNKRCMLANFHFMNNATLGQNIGDSSNLYISPSRYLIKNKFSCGMYIQGHVIAPPIYSEDDVPLEIWPTIHIIPKEFMIPKMHMGEIFKRPTIGGETRLKIHNELLDVWKLRSPLDGRSL